MLVAILPCAVLVIYQNVQQRDRDVDRARADSVQLAHVLAGQYEETRQDANNLLAVLAAQSGLSDPDRCAVVMRSLLQEFKQYLNVGVADLNGRIICSGLGVQSDISDRDYFKVALATTSFAEGTYQIGRVTGLPSIGYAYPVRNAAGQTIAVMVATVDLSWFSRGLSRVNLPEGATATLFDRNGVLLARFPDPAPFVGQSYSDSELLNHTKDGSANTFEARGLDGVNRFYAYTLVGDSRQPAVLAVGLPESTIFGRADANLSRGIIFLIGVAILAVIFASIFSDFFLVRRLRSLVAASRRLAGNDLTARSGLTIRFGELGELSRSFDRMADAIEKRDRKNLEVATSLEKKVRQLDALHGVFSKITETLHTEDVIRAAIVQAGQLVDAEVTVLRLIKGTELEVAGFDSRDPDTVLDLKPVTVGEGLIGKVAQTAKTMRFERDVQNQMRPGQGITGAQSGIAVPVIIHGTVLGTLGCWATRPSAFSFDDERLLEMLATQIAAAITAATSREDSDRLARIDSLTGLPNRLQLSEDEASVERTAADQGLAVLMIDIDWFKRVNDEYGHLLGDRVLRQVATVLRQVLRSTDHVYRFGGEEFLRDRRVLQREGVDGVGRTPAGRRRGERNIAPRQRCRCPRHDFAGRSGDELSRSQAGRGHRDGRPGLIRRQEERSQPVGTLGRRDQAKYRRLT